MTGDGGLKARILHEPSQSIELSTIAANVELEHARPLGIQPARDFNDVIDSFIGLDTAREENSEWRS